jgi:serine/threonine protein kinase
MKLADYEVGITLGTGSFGRVKLARNKVTNKWVALKMLKKAEIIRLK